MKSWKAVVKAYEGLLLSGKNVVYSAPFERKMDAQAWMDAVVEQNESAGHEVDYENSTIFSGLYPWKSVVKARKVKARPPARAIGRASK